MNINPTSNRKLLKLGWLGVLMMNLKNIQNIIIHKACPNQYKILREFNNILQIKDIEKLMFNKLLIMNNKKLPSHQ